MEAIYSWILTSAQNNYFLVLNLFSCVCVCVCTARVGVSVEAIRGLGSPGTGVRGRCKPPKVSAGN